MLNQIDLSRVDINLLVLFEAIVAERHVGRAATRLNLTPSAVSHGLGRLRRLLDDPLFLRTPRGVTPTARALDLAGPVADILARVRAVVATATRFDPATSARRFTIGAPDGVSAVFLPRLLADLGAGAPRVDVSLRQLLPAPDEPAPERAWRGVHAELDARGLDVAVVPVDAAPARFHRRPLWREDFVVATRAGHPFAADPSLERYCAARHLVVSDSGDAFGFVDTALAAVGRARRVALTVPTFMFALAVLAETDLVAALPRGLVALHAERFGLAAAEAPLPLPTFGLTAVAPVVALVDPAMTWLLERLEAACRAG